METLLNALGGNAFWPVLQAGGLVAVVGMLLRARALRRLDDLGLAVAARRRVRDVGPGLACVQGRWRRLDLPCADGRGRGPGRLDLPCADGRGPGRLDERRGLVEDESGAALVAFADGHAGAAPADGTEVIVVGLGGGVVADPRGAGYRNDARLPQLAIVDADHFVRPTQRSVERDVVRQRAVALAAGFAFAVGLALAATAVVVALRASAS
jgi:hypothetical protein